MRVDFTTPDSAGYIIIYTFAGMMFCLFGMRVLRRRCPRLVDSEMGAVDLDDESYHSNTIARDLAYELGSGLSSLAQRVNYHLQERLKDADERYKGHFKTRRDFAEELVDLIDKERGLNFKESDDRSNHNKNILAEDPQRFDQFDYLDDKPRDSANRLAPAQTPVVEHAVLPAKISAPPTSKPEASESGSGSAEKKDLWSEWDKYRIDAPPPQKAAVEDGRFQTERSFAKVDNASLIYNR